jgi:hypothetical protein
MKVAICFSGMPRSFKSVLESHKKYIYNVLSDHGIEYDIFIHSWNNEVTYPKYIPDEGSTKELIELYQPTSYKLETYNKAKVTELLCGSRVDEYHKYITCDNKIHDIADWIGGGLLTNNTISLFYGLNQSNNLRKKYEQENGFEYDVIIKSRFDNIMFDELNINTLSNELDTVFCPMGYEPDDRERLGTVNDILAVGDRKGMDTYMSLYNRLYELLKERYDLNHPRPWHTIGLTKHNLVKNNIQIKRFYLDHIVTRRLHKYKAVNSVVTGEGWDIPVPKTNDIIIESNKWI